MEKKDPGKKSVANLALIVFFVIGLTLIMSDMIKNISTEAANGQVTFYGYVDSNAGSNYASDELLPPTPTIDPILKDFNQ